MKKILAIIPVIILLSLLLATPIVACDGLVVSDIDSSEQWLSGNPESVGTDTTTISVTVSNEGTHRGKATPLLYGVNGDFTWSSVEGSFKTINASQDKTWTFDLTVKPTTSDGYYDVSALYLGLEKYGWIWLPSFPSGCEDKVFGVDSTKPTVTLTPTTHTSGTMTYNSSALDNLSGIAVHQYQVNGGPWIDYCGNFTLPKSNMDINVRGLDNAGNPAATTLKLVWYTGNGSGMAGQPMYDWKYPYKLLVYGVDYGWDLSVPGGKFWRK